jgi:chromodomain-helicase-DNA-binding protein 4
MANVNQLPDSEASEEELARTPERQSIERDPSQPQSVLSHRFRESSQKAQDRRKQKSSSAESSIAVMVPPPAKPWEYQKWREDMTVDSILEETKGPDGQLQYNIEYEDGKQDTVSAVLQQTSRFEAIIWRLHSYIFRLVVVVSSEFEASVGRKVLPTSRRT